MPEEEIQNRLLHLLETFISFPSVSGHVHSLQECLNWIETAFLTHDTAVRHGTAADTPYTYVQHPNPKLLWFAHIDVVPVMSDQQWTLTVDGNRAYGRGTKDMKGAALPFLLAYYDVRNRGLHPPVNILLTTDEETGGKSVPHIIEEEQIQVPAAFTPDTGSYNWIAHAHKGGVRATITARGHGGHAAMPWTTQNPVWILAEAIHRLKEEYETKDDAWTMTVTPTVLSASQAVNQVPDTASCDLDIRFPAEECSTADDALEKIRPFLPENCTIEAGIAKAPLSTDPNHPEIQRLRHIASDIYGADVGLGVEPGATDARFFAEYGMPSFLYGPYGEELHGVNEWVSVSSLCTHYKIMRRLLEELCE